MQRQRLPENSAAGDQRYRIKTIAPVIGGFGLRGFGAYSTNAEYILISSFEPRLNLAARMIMGISSGTGKTPLK